MSIWTDFKEFAVRGSVVDLAVGIIIGSAFNKIVDSIVTDLVMPPLGIVLGRTKDLNNYYINLSGKTYNSLAEAQAAGAPTINYGHFINTVINFIILAFVIFLIVRWINSLRAGKTTEKVPTQKKCPYCTMNIPIGATRCPECTAELPLEEGDAKTAPAG